MPSYESPEAREGTLAHHVAEYCLRGGYDAKGLTQFEGKDLPEDMAPAVQVYLDAVRGKLNTGDTIMVEVEFDLSTIHPGLFGTADAALVPAAARTGGRRLYVFDYKHGKGKVVEAKNNPQLRYYALGALLKCRVAVDDVELIIVQPRANHPDGPVRSEVLSVGELLDFKIDLKDYAVATEAKDAPLKSGDWCRWCKAKPTCPKLADQQKAIATNEFQSAVAVPNWTPTPEWMANALQQCEAAEIRIAAIRELAYQSAMQGRPPAGMKLVAKRATRKWRDEREAYQVCSSLLKLQDADIYEPQSVRSPAQIEDRVGKKRFKEDASAYVKAESSGYALVAESDGREAIKLDAKSDFAAIPVVENKALTSLFN